jgi:hypothetical protein
MSNKNKEINKVVMFSFVQLIYLISFLIDWKHTKEDKHFDNFDLLIHGLNSFAIILLLYYYYYHDDIMSFKVKFVVLVIVIILNIDLFLYFHKTKSQ